MMQLYTLLTLGLSISGFITSEARILSDRHSHWAVGQTVNTQSGYVTGRAASNASQVSVYLGIPYAQPPVGDLRFAPPQKYTGKTPVDVAKFGFSCPISSAFGGGAPANTTGKNLTAAGYAALESLLQTGDVFSEDCLTLNIWTKPQVGERRKAVMVWLYGGGFQSGRSFDANYDGQYMADQEDVVVVSFNYRMNIFGFPGNPHGNLNPGLLDQRLAIEWVRDNISSFGGDPSRIILFGQSAGAASIDFYSYVYMHDPIVSGLILESGTTSLGTYTIEDTSAAWYNVTATLGCGNSTSDQTKLMECMRLKSTSEITSAIPLSDAPTGAAAFWPTIDNVTIFAYYPSRAAAGNFLHVPLLIGNNDNEAGYYKAIASLYNTYLPDAQWESFSNYVFACPASQRANASAKAGVPVWRYRYFGEFEDLRLTNEGEGAYHGAEVAVVLGTSTDGGGGKEEREVGRYLRGAWAAFAKDPWDGLRCYGSGWPEYGSERESLIRLAWNDSVGIDMVSPEVYDSVCQ